MASNNGQLEGNAPALSDLESPFLNEALFASQELESEPDFSSLQNHSLFELAFDTGPQEEVFVKDEISQGRSQQPEDEESFVEGKEDEDAFEDEDDLQQAPVVANTFFRIANDITGAFEGGKPGTLNLYDRGIISYGKHQATLASGTLYSLLKRFTEVSPGKSAQGIAPYLDRVKKQDETLVDEKAFIQLLKAAATEPEMLRAQDEVFAKEYWKPAKKAAAEVGVTSALGHVIFYDTRVNGGLKTYIKKTLKRLGGKVGHEVKGQPIMELDFLRVFEEERVKGKLRASAKQALAAKQLEASAKALENKAAAADPATAAELRQQAKRKRTEAKRNAANAGALERSAKKTRGPTFKALVDSGDLDLRGDADGLIRLVGKPGVIIKGLEPHSTVDEVHDESEQEEDAWEPTLSEDFESDALEAPFDDLEDAHEEESAIAAEAPNEDHSFLELHDRPDEQGGHCPECGGALHLASEAETGSVLAPADSFALSLATEYILEKRGFTGLFAAPFLASSLTTELKRGNRDANDLTKRLYEIRHPDLKGHAIPPKGKRSLAEEQLAQEWLELRRRIVQPALLSGPAIGPIHTETPVTSDLRHKVPADTILSPLAITLRGLRKAPHRMAEVKQIVVHNTSRGPANRSIDKAYRRSAMDFALDYYIGGDGGFPHYVIDFNGTIYAACDERFIAHHAGWVHARGKKLFQDPSWKPPVWWSRVWSAHGARTPIDLLPAGATSPNSRSIGIELLILPELRYTTAQYGSLARLIADIEARHSLSILAAPSPVLLGHEDYSPVAADGGRADSKGGWDPGAHRDKPYFDWNRLWSELRRPATSVPVQEAQ